MQQNEKTIEVKSSPAGVRREPFELFSIILYFHYLFYNCFSILQTRHSDYDIDT